MWISIPTLSSTSYVNLGGRKVTFIYFFIIFNVKFIFERERERERERQNVSRGGAEREGDTESEADSKF